jgi:hypothetical protein
MTRETAFGAGRRNKVRAVSPGFAGFPACVAAATEKTAPFKLSASQNVRIRKGDPKKPGI